MKGETVIEVGVHYLKCPLVDIWTGVTVIDDERLIIIDTGTQTAVGETIMPFLDATGLADSREVLIVNTHCHCDHIGGNAGLRILLGAQIAAHRADASFIEDRNRQFQVLFGVFATDPAMAMDLQGFMAFAGQDTPVNWRLDDGDVIDLGRRKLRVIHTPGHSAGSITLFDERSGILFAGDSAQCNGTTDTLVPLIVDIEAYRASLRTLLACEARLLIMDHPFKPYSEAIFRSSQIKVFLDDCLAWVDHYEAMVDSFLTSGAGEGFNLKNAANYLAEQSDIVLNVYTCILAAAFLDQSVKAGDIRRLSGTGTDPTSRFVLL